MTIITEVVQWEAKRKMKGLFSAEQIHIREKERSNWRKKISFFLEQIDNEANREIKRTTSCYNEEGETSLNVCECVALKLKAGNSVRNVQMNGRQEEGKKAQTTAKMQRTDKCRNLYLRKWHKK